MSHFTVAFNQVLDRMKITEAMTRQRFALRIGMPLSTLTSYADGRNPDQEALGTIVSSLTEDDGKRLIIARLQDEIPIEWTGRISVSAEINIDPAAPINFENLPPSFEKAIRAMVSDARRNKHLIGFVEEFASLMGFDLSEKTIEQRAVDVLCPSPSQFPTQSVPGAAHFQSGSSMATRGGNSLNEEVAQKQRGKGPSAKAVGLRGKLRAMNEGKKES